MDNDGGTVGALAVQDVNGDGFVEIFVPNYVRTSHVGGVTVPLEFEFIPWIALTGQELHERVDVHGLGVHADVGLAFFFSQQLKKTTFS